MTEPGKIKVLQLVEDLSIGGMERVIQSLALGLPGEEYELLVWCLTRGGAIADELKSAGIEVEVLGMGSRCTVPFLIKLTKMMVARRIDILHAHGYSATTIGRTAGFLARVPVMIAHVHSTYWEYSKKQLAIERALGLVSDKIICCSRAVEAFVTGREKISPRKTAVVYNGVADMRRVDDGGLRVVLGLAPDDFVAGVAASLVPHKGHFCFLKAMKAAVKVNPKIKAVLAGAGTLRKELEAFSESLGISGNVVFCGIVRDMKPLLSAVDVAVLPSIEREGLSLAILEAMSAEKAVIGTRVGGVPEAVSDGETGLLVAPGDPAALAAAILSLERDREMLKKMGRAGRSLYEDKFAGAKMIVNTVRIYEELLGR